MGLGPINNNYKPNFFIMKNKNFTLYRRITLAATLGLVLSANAFSQLADPDDYSSAEAVTLNADDLSGKYVIQCGSEELYMSTLIDQTDMKNETDKSDSVIHATDDLTDCYAFDIVKNSDGSYKVLSGTYEMVWGLTNGWFVEFVEPETGGNPTWKINLQADNTVTFERFTEAGKFIKHEVNGINLGLTKFYSDANADHADIYFNLLKVGGGPAAVKIASENALNVFPNPVSDVLNISNIPANSELTLINVLGQVVYTQQAETTTLKLSVENLEEGIYFVKSNNQLYKILVK